MTAGAQVISMFVASAGSGDREPDRIDFFLIKLIGKD
jgi:hypothetical protein